MKLSILTLACVLSGYLLYSQSDVRKSVYRPPLDIPIFLSGTFGELRSDHFHSGMDIRVGGKEGLPIYAIADGYVSRVGVSPVGFGKVLYINHQATDHTSVYAHLQNFAPRIAQWVKQQQYDQKKFSINIYTAAELFPVKKGELIGYAGNSGSSGGAHLHFELRDVASQEVINPLLWGFQTKDFIRPSISRLAVYPENNSAQINGNSKPLFIEVQGWGEQHRLKDQKTIKASGQISFGITTADMHNDTPNTNGVYAIELWADSTLLFHFKADRFSFDETRYINSMIDYRFYKKHESRIVRTKRDPLNNLRLIEKLDQRGIFTVNEGDTINFVYIVKDFHGNLSKLPFKVVGVKNTAGAKAGADSAAGDLVVAGKPYQISEMAYEAKFPAETFYRDEFIQHAGEGNFSAYSPRITLGTVTIPVHKSYELKIKTNPQKTASSKLTVVHLHKEKKTPLGGKWENGWMKVTTRVLGDFVVMADTVPPTLKAVNFQLNGSIDTINQLKINVKDDFSGIRDVEPSLNGSWLLMDYDPKNNLLVYEIDERLLKGKNRLKVVVTDQCGNQSVLEANLYR